jgi:hypothetical protein
VDDEGEKYSVGPKGCKFSKELGCKKSLAKMMSVKEMSSGKIGELREQNKNERFRSFMGIQSEMVTDKLRVEAENVATNN